MFLATPDTPEATAFLAQETAETGYTMNLERAWAWRPDVAQGFVALRKQLSSASRLTAREFALLVCATAQALGDSYCALAWGTRLARLSDPALAAAVLRGEAPSGLDARERALSEWARQVVTAPNKARREQVEGLRAVGLSDREIFEATAFVALRLAFSSVNDALGASPDAELVRDAPPMVVEAVTYGRAPAA